MKSREFIIRGVICVYKWQPRNKYMEEKYSYTVYFHLRNPILLSFLSSPDVLLRLSSIEPFSTVPEGPTPVVTRRRLFPQRDETQNTRPS